MDNPIFEFLSKYIDLTDEEKAIVSDIKFVRSLKKGTVLLTEGETTQECFFYPQRMCL